MGSRNRRLRICDGTRNRSGHEWAQVQGTSGRIPGLYHTICNPSSEMARLKAISFRYLDRAENSVRMVAEVTNHTSHREQAGLTVFMGAETYGILLEREHIPIIVLVCSTFP